MIKPNTLRLSVLWFSYRMLGGVLKKDNIEIHVTYCDEIVILNGSHSNERDFLFWNWACTRGPGICIYRENNFLCLVPLGLEQNSESHGKMFRKSQDYISVFSKKYFNIEVF